MPNHRGKFAPTYEGPYVIKKAFSKGALILADMDENDFNMPTNSNAVIRYFAWRSLAVHLIFIFSCQKEKEKENTKQKTKQNKNMQKVDRKPERAVYTKWEPKEREREKIQKVDRKPEKVVHAKAEQKKKKKTVWESLLNWKLERAV